jgi:hypothetical protein
MAFSSKSYVLPSFHHMHTVHLILLGVIIVIISSIISDASGPEPVNTAVGIRHADHVAPSTRNSWH